jgi:glyoxylase-like metal-dependent hydrolase (beta-lactamase superfamily II)
MLGAALTALPALSACAHPTPEQQIVNDAADALGGRQRLLNLHSLTMAGEGRQFNLGQDVRPEAAGQTFTVSGLTRRIDLGSGRSQTELTRTPNFPYFQGQAPQKQIQGIDGDVAYNIGANGTATRALTPVANDRRAEILHHPVAIVRAAISTGTTVANARTAGDERLVDITTPGGMHFVLAIDKANLPVRVESKTDQANLGDVTISTHFSDYQTVGGLKVPGKIVTKTDDFTTSELTISHHTVDGDTGNLSAPPATVAAPPAAAPPPPNVTADQIAPWIWVLAGQSHHSVLLEFRDHLALIDAPQSEARTLAVIAKAHQLRPDKPLTKLITTHHHFDHTAGVRAAIAEGMGIITQSGNRAFFEEMARRPHTIVADTLAKTPKPLTIETVDEELIIGGAPGPVALYHVAGNPHSETMLMVHMPSERVLVEVDAFSPGSDVQPYAANLLENITTRKLQVDRIVSLHGSTVPFAELVKAVPASATSR